MHTMKRIDLTSQIPRRCVTPVRIYVYVRYIQEQILMTVNMLTNPVGCKSVDAVGGI